MSLKESFKTFFTRHKPQKHVVKLVKIVDQQAAGLFDMVACINTVIDMVQEHTMLKADHFDINYTRTLKSLTGFRKALTHNTEITFLWVGFGNSDKTDTYIMLDNPMVNYIEKPEQSTIDLMITVGENYISKENLLKISGQLSYMFEFDSAYETTLNHNIDPITGNKIKNGLFTVSEKEGEPVKWKNNSTK